MDARQEAFLLEVYRFTVFTKGFAATEVGFFFFQQNRGSSEEVSVLASVKRRWLIPSLHLGRESVFMIGLPFNSLLELYNTQLEWLHSALEGSCAKPLPIEKKQFYTIL